MTLPIPKNVGDTREFRACLSSYIVFAVIFGGLAVFLTLVLLATNASDFQGWLAVGSCLAVLAFSYYWLSRFHLVIGSEFISYASLFSVRRTIRRSEIIATEFVAEPGPYETPFTIVVITESGDDLRINSKVFSLDAVRALLALVK